MTVITTLKQAALVGSLFLGVAGCGPEAQPDSTDKAQGAESAAASAVDKDAPPNSETLVETTTRTYAFRDAANYPASDSLRKFNVRVELQVAFDNGQATYVRSHRSITCYENVAHVPATDWQSHACSLESPYLDLYKQGPSTVNQVSGTTTNTGSDGYSSVYGNWERVSTYGCYWGAALRSNSTSTQMRVGLASKYFSVPNLWTSTYANYNVCD